MARDIKVGCKAKKCDHEKLEGQFLLQHCMRCNDFEFKLKGNGK